MVEGEGHFCETRYRTRTIEAPVCAGQKGQFYVCASVTKAHVFLVNRSLSSSRNSTFITLALVGGEGVAGKQHEHFLQLEYRCSDAKLSNHRPAPEDDWPRALHQQPS